MKEKYVVEAMNRDGHLVDCSCEAINKTDAEWIFSHSPHMIGMYPRWFTLRRQGARKPKRPADYIEPLLPPQNRSAKNYE